jgi:hypothetical protein
MTYTIQELRDKGLIIFEAIMGSQAYGTNTPQSDTDIRGVFVQPLEDALKYGYVDQVSDETNDTTFYELGRFMFLLIGNNPNILELLAAPEDCVIYRDDMFKLLENAKDKFLTKRVRWTFAGYAIDQIQKARGYNKKMNWEENEMVRKNVLDFCYVLHGNGSMLFNDWMQLTRLHRNDTQKNYGLAAVDHGHNLFAMFYNEEPVWGLVSDEEKANQVQLFSIPKGLDLVANLYFNADGYSTHCKKYLEFTTWLKERNPNRFKMNKDHGKNYDSKNLMHCMRLLEMVAEMLDKGELIVRRPKEHIELLMTIRRGEMEYEYLLKMAEDKIASLDEKCAKSSLPEKVDIEFTLNLLLELRKHFYNLQ